MTTATKYNRAELLQLALDGKVTKGDKFKDERGNTATYNGFEFIWDADGKSLLLFVHEREHFTPVLVDREVTITLKQSEINSLRILSGGNSFHELQQKKARYSHPWAIVEDGNKYEEMFDKLEKEVR